MSDVTSDLPQATIHRLEELEKGLFNSDLSVNKFLLVKRGGLSPRRFCEGVVDLSHRHSNSLVGTESGVDEARRGDVQCSRTYNDAHGGREVQGEV